MFNPLAACYIVLGATIVAIEAQRVKSRQPFDALSLFNGAYAIFFVFVPLNLLACGEMAVRQKHAYLTWSHGDVWTALTLLLTYVLFVLGYHAPKARAVGVVGRLPVGAVTSRVPSKLVAFFFVVGAISLAYHISLMGGIVETVYFAPQARTGEFKLLGHFLFVRQFCYFLATAFMLYWALYIDTNPNESSERTYRVLPHLIIASLGIFFVFYAVSTYGRREFLYPIVICFVIWIVGGGNRSWSKLGWLIFLSCLWVSIYTFVIPASQPSASQPSASQPAIDFLSGAYFRTVQGLADSFMHFVAAQHAELWQFGFLTDLLEIPSQFLPSQLLGFERGRGMFGETSAFILGHPLESGLSGEEPLGLHGYLLVNFGYPGLFVLFFLLGIAYRILDRTLRPAKGESALAWLVFMWAMVGALEFLREGVLVLVLKQRFSWWLAIGILMWQKSRRAIKGPNGLSRKSVG